VFPEKCMKLVSRDRWLKTSVMFVALASNGSIAMATTESDAPDSRVDGAALDAAMQRTTGQVRFDDMTHDFGRVMRGQRLTHAFRFTNVGKGPLSIQGVHATCGCTAAEVAKGKEYAPGESGTVEVAFDTTDFVGRISKVVTVMTNERHLPDRTLTISATIAQEFEVTPPLVDFGDVYSREGATRSVTIKPVAGVKFAIEAMKFNSEALVVEQRRMESGNVVLDVKLRPDVTTGFFRDTIMVINSSRTLRELPIPVRANIRGSIEFAPRYVEFGAIAGSDKANRSVTLTGKEKFEITSTRSEININGTRFEDAAKLVKVNMVEHEKQRRLVSIDLVNAAGRAGSVHGKLYLETTDPQQKQLVVDFYAFFR